MAQGTKVLATKSEDPSLISGALIVKGKEWTPKISSTTFLPGAKMIRNNGRLFPGWQKSPHLSFHFVMEDSVKTDQVLPGWLSKTPFVNKGMKGIFSYQNLMPGPRILLVFKMPWRRYCSNNIISMAPNLCLHGENT